MFTFIEKKYSLIILQKIFSLLRQLTMIKKIVSILIFSIMIWNVLAVYISSNLKSNLENYYNKWVASWTNYYWNYNNKLKTLEKKFSTGDYKILWLLTWIDISWTFNQEKSYYSDYVKNITKSKYEIMGNLSILETNLKNWLISSWEYEKSLENIALNISWYKTYIKKELNNLIQSLSWEYNNLNSKIDNLMKKYYNDIKKYKDYEKNISELNKLYKELEWNNNKLIKIIWTTKQIIKNKNTQIKEFVNQYYSWMLQKEFEKFLNEDNNMSYFKSWFNLKKQVLLGFINNKLDNNLDKIVNNYYPNIDIDSIKQQIDDINKNPVTKIIKDHSNLMSLIKKLKNTIKSYNKIITEKLNEFKSTDKENIKKKIENDLIMLLDNSTKLVKDDIKQTLIWWKTFIKDKEKEESILMSNLRKAYWEALQKNTIQSLESFLSTLTNYRNKIVLQSNIKTINNYKYIVQKTLEELKLKDIRNKLNDINTNIKSVHIWDLTWLNNIKNKLDNLYNYANKMKLKKDLLNQLNNLKLQLKLKENIHTLYKVWAISFYYTYWDLTNTVYNILMKYYKKYEKIWKKDLFIKKVDKAFEKLLILEKSLNNDIRSYYIIMIHNWLLKFKYQN